MLGFLLLGTTNEVSAQTLRIAPEDLRWRTSVSKELSPAIRLRLRDLAAKVPIPTTDSARQTRTLLELEFPPERVQAERLVLLHYYFLLARMEQSREFSREFARRKTRTDEGLKLLDDYLKQVDRAAARGLFSDRPTPALEPQAGLPLESVGWETNSEGIEVLKVLHHLPKPEARLGRETLRAYRRAALEDRQRLAEYRGDIDTSEREFLREVATLGEELRKLRPEIRNLVPDPAAGLPFSF